MKLISILKLAIKKSWMLFCRLDVLNKVYIVMSSIFLIVPLVVTLMHNIIPSILSKDSWQILFLTPTSLFFFVSALSILKIGEAFAKIIGVFLSSYYILSGFLLQVLIVSKINTVDFGKLFVIFFIFISSLILLMIIVFKSLEHYFIDKLLIIIFGFAIYSIIIFDGNFIFFIYYTGHNYLSQETINDFKHIKGQLDILKILCSTTMSRFFNYPSDPKLPLSYYLPYFIGKLADLFVLGYVFSKITSSESRKVLVKKSKDLKEKIYRLKNENKGIKDEYNKSLAFLYQLHLLNNQDFKLKTSKLKNYYENRINRLAQSIKKNNKKAK